MNIRIDNIFYTAALGTLLFLILIFGAPLIKPLVFASFFSIMLIPIQNFYGRFIKHKLLNVIITIFTVLIPLAAILFLFFMQAKEIFSSFPSISSMLSANIQSAIELVNEKTPFNVSEIDENIFQGDGGLPKELISFLSSGLSTTVTTITLVFLTLLFLVFLMWYRTAIVKFIIIQFSDDRKVEIHTILHKARKMVVSYLAGLGIVMLIMAILNSIGLTVIGVKYAIFFGVLAAFLTVVPYVGTTIGGTLPFVYVLVTGGGWLQAILVVAFYFTIQQIEGNFITPKIVGDSVQVNPFAAILGITLGTFIWGVAGIILAIPILGLIRIICDEVDALKPISFLLSNNIIKHTEEMELKYDNEKYRLSSLFKKNSD